MPWVERLLGRFSLVGDREFFNTGLFPWVHYVEMDSDVIRYEMMHVLKTRNIPPFHEISPEQGAISSGTDWKTFFLYAYGERQEENCDLCPLTDLALRKIPGMVTAFYSILEPGARLPPHRGPYKGVLRYHLALTVPLSGAGIRVGSETRFWYAGSGLIFDDTFPHEAWNISDERRVILFVDFLRPLPFPLNLLNRALVRYIRSTEFVQAGVRRLRERS